MNKTENYIREFFEIFFAQKRLIIWTMLLFFVVSVLIALFWPPVYSATGSILVKGKKIQKSPESLSQTYEDFYPVTKEDLVSEEHMLVSFEVAKRTLLKIKKAGLYRRRKKKGFFENIAKYFGAKHDLKKRAEKDGLPQKTINEIYGILGNIKSQVIPSSNVIKIVYFDRDPAYATLVLDTIMKEYLAYRQEVINPNNVEAFYVQQIKRFRTMLGEKQQTLLALTQKTHVTNPKREIENNLLMREDLIKQLVQLRRDLIEKENYVRHLEETLKNKKIQFFSFITIDQSKTITYISERLLDAFVERENVLKKYKSGSFRVKLVTKKIQDLYKTLRKEVISYTNDKTNKILALKRKIAFIEKRIDEIGKMNLALKSQELQTHRILMDIDILKKSYITLQRRGEEARMNRVINAANLSYFVSILNHAFPSDGPIFPKKRVVIPLGILIGLIIGCSFGFMREYFDHTFKRPSDVENYLGLPVIFSIPKVESYAKKILSSAMLFLLISVILGAFFVHYFGGNKNLEFTQKRILHSSLEIPTSFPTSIDSPMEKRRMKS